MLFNSVCSLSPVVTIFASDLPFGQKVVWVSFKHSSHVHQLYCLSCWGKQTRLERAGWWTDEEFCSDCGFQRSCSDRIRRCDIIRGETFFIMDFCGSWPVFELSWCSAPAALQLPRASYVVTFPGTECKRNCFQAEATTCLYQTHASSVSATALLSLLAFVYSPRVCFWKSHTSWNSWQFYIKDLQICLLKPATSFP